MEEPSLGIQLVGHLSYVLLVSAALVRAILPLRLLAIDCEETFKSEMDRRAVEADWAGYVRKKRGDSKRTKAVEVADAVKMLRDDLTMLERVITPGGAGSGRRPHPDGPAGR